MNLIRFINSLSSTAILILFLYGCQKSANDLPIISPANLIEQGYSIDKITESIEYIPLDSGKQLSNIENIKANGDGYWIKTAQGLFRYNKKGKYLNSIGRKGKGADEYIGIWDYEIDEIKNEVYILVHNKVKVYDYSGKYIRQFSTPDQTGFNSFKWFNNHLYYPYEYGFKPLKNLYASTNNNGKSVQQQINGHEKEATFNVQYGHPQLIASNKSLYYWNLLNDTIYSISDNIIKPAYLWSKDQFRVSSNDLSSENNYRAKNSWQIIDFTASNRFFFFQYILLNKKKKVYTIFDRTLNKMQLVSEKRFSDTSLHMNKLDNGPEFYPKYIWNEKNQSKALMWVNAFELKALIQDKAFDVNTSTKLKEKDRLKQLGSQLLDNDNPVLMVINLKR
ncbi:6-bladed beta-propeller [Prolixibacteraceae bacterium JC049]|nr:6-bladed beta-propeller [Prolixibacteraceae bacterium JC049]